MSNNVRQYYSLLCIVYRYVGILGVFFSPNAGILSLVRVTQITQFENGFSSL